MVALGIAGAIFSCLFVLSFGYAQHAPHPHDVRIDVAASAGVADQVRTALEQAAPGGFDVRPVASEAAARRHLRDMSTDGALIESAAGPARLLTAGAAGVPLQHAIDQALTAVVRAQGRAAQLVDVVPLPRDDRAGLAPFALELGLLVPAVAAAIGLYLMGRRARLWIRVAGATAYTIVAAALAVLMLDASLGALTGAPWALFGDAAMVAGTLALTVVALHALFGMQGTALAAGALFVVGNAINGSAVPTRLLPDVYRQIAPWLPNNAAISLVRSDVYFDGHGQAGPLLTLTIWIAAAALIIVGTDLLHLRLRRAMPNRGQEIYAMPVLGHLRARRAGSKQRPSHEAAVRPGEPERPTEPAQPVSTPAGKPLQPVDDVHSSGPQPVRCDVELAQESRKIVVTVTYPAA